MNTSPAIYRVPPCTKVTFGGRDYVAGDVIRGYTPPEKAKIDTTKKEGDR